MPTALLQDPARPAAPAAQPAPSPQAEASAAASVSPPENGAGTLALHLYAQVLGASTLQTAAHRLAATLSSELKLSRVGVGLVAGQTVRLLAVTDHDPRDAQSVPPQRLLGALHESVEQGRSLAWPDTDAGHDARHDARHDTTHDAVRLEHQQWQREAGGAVASVPLGAGGEVFAVVGVQRDDGPPFTPRELQRLECLLALAAPALRWMDLAQQPWRRRTAFDLRQAWARLRQPERLPSRRLLAAVGAALAFLALAPLDHTVSGRARVEGAEQRALVAPADGFVKAVHVRPGDRVMAGAPLLDLREADLRLERERWASQLAQHENAYAAAMAKPDRAAAATSLARISEAQSQLTLVDEQLLRGRIVAPFDAIVIQGDLSQSVGAPVRQGETLLTLATSGHHRVIVDVDEVDIAAVLPGQTGRLALSSWAWRSEDIVVERITPLARAVEGRNVFEVEARLVSPRADLRPGLLGRAELVVGRLPPLWAWASHALDRVRVAWWSWLG